MNKSKIVIFLSGILLGILVGWTTNTLIQRSQVLPPEDNPGHSINQMDAAKPDQSEHIQDLEVRNVSLMQQVADLKKELDAYQQKEQDGTDPGKERTIASRLKEYQTLFDLTPEQAYFIGEWEWELALHWKEFIAGKRTADDPIPYVEDKVRGILSPDQLEIYDAHMKEKNHRSAEVSAQMRLSAYPTNLDMTEEQKDALYEKLYYMHHKSTKGDFEERLNVYRHDRGYDILAAYLRVAADGVLSEDQLKDLEAALGP